MDTNVLDQGSERMLEPVMSGALAAMTSSEIDRQIATAKNFPRSLTDFRRQAAELITLDQESASACIYALPRGKEKNPQTGNWEKKIIKGPTARFAEAVAYAWGNCRFASRIVGEDEQFVTAAGMFFDVEKNVAVSYEVKRRITDSEGKRYSADMIAMTANAACSIALRNAVLKGVPQPIWKGLYTAAEQTIAGDRKGLAQRRQETIDQFKAHGLTPAMVCQLVGAGGTADVGGEQIVQLQGMLTALKDGDVTIESLLSESQDKGAAERGKAKIEEIKARYRRPEVEVSPEADVGVKEVARQAQERLDEKRRQAKEKVVMPTAAEIGFERPMPKQASPAAPQQGAMTEEGMVDEKW